MIAVMDKKVNLPRVIIIGLSPEIEQRNRALIDLVNFNMTVFLLKSIKRAFVDAFLIEDTESSMHGRVSFIPMTEAASLFKFPPGHPHDRHAYVLHPCGNFRYIPIASFHRIVFEEKVSELLNLLGALGANYVRVRAVEGSITSMGVNLSATIPVGVPTSMKTEGACATSSASEIYYEMEMTGSSKPYVPVDCIWLESEPTWSALVNARMNHGAKNFHVFVRHDDEMGVSASLCTSIQGAGFQLGGKMTNFERTTWAFSGTFR